MNIGEECECLLYRSYNLYQFEIFQNKLQGKKRETLHKQKRDKRLILKRGGGSQPLQNLRITGRVPE